MSSAEKHKPFVWKDRAKSFVFAFKGIKQAVVSQHNMWIHIVIMMLVIGLGFFFDINNTEWIVFILCIGMVISAEIFNTAIEALVDLHSPDYSEKAGLIKDMAAGAVLITAIAAVIVGCIIFIPYIYRILI